MSGAVFLGRAVRDARGASAAEFALILPIFLLFFFGLIDAGRFLYEVNRGEKATQIGARMAVVTDPIAQSLMGASYVGASVGGSTLSQGDRIPAAAFGSLVCNQTSCTGTEPHPGTTQNDAAFQNLLSRMQQIMPAIEADNLVIEYRGSGLGYAGNPNGMDISPLVTVRLTGMNFSPILLFGGNIDLPDFSYTLTMEDGDGTESN
ncbi:TadE/TadG family type IV pilus assembly protein [Sphingopyxis flava]|uniref:Flp pilus assembly protein TadG n=1 Tax=Sphingopyxis flava TaxID=1507287 RepID=A0A1T5EVR5_9SPHN|nr:TadE/TadG family type IV pilus assembly protein [Sphingopyxis flava]SKB88045.1 Flp pilus assembly protein TadG [Sphingopyxis flava]